MRLPAQAVATNVGVRNTAPKAEPKEPVRGMAVDGTGGVGAVGTAETVPSEPAVAKAGGVGAGVAGGAATEPSKAAGNPIELTPIGGHAKEPAPAVARETDSKGGTGGWGMSGLGGMLQTAAALAIVIGLIFIGRALARKYVPGARAGSGKGVIEILARHPLAKNQAIVLVRIGSQIVALNQGREASESVLVISDATEVAKIIGQIEGKNPQSMQAGFNRLLANARMDLEEEGGNGRPMSDENLDEQLEEMAAAKRQLMELRQHVRSVRDSLPRT